MEPSTNQQKAAKAPKKSAKQQFLDTAGPDGSDLVVTILLTNYARTKLAKMGREVKEMREKVLYKTQMREMSFEEIYEALEKAHKLAMSESESDAGV